jgi:lysophospholipase L1-like esterase
MSLSRSRRTAFVAIVIAAAWAAGEVVVRIANPCIACDARALRPPYNRQPWALQLFAELPGADEMRYAPFIEWAPRAIDRQYVHVTSDGQRRTWNPPSAGDARQAIYVFGGSTTFGIGARDEYTWPSHLSKLLNASSPAFEVRNYAVPAYSFNQEIIKFMHLLRDGHRPSTAIFYDGVNDVWLAYQYGIVNATLSEDVFHARLDPGNDLGRLETDIRGLARRACQSCRLALAMARQVIPGLVRPWDEGFAGASLDTPQLVQLGDRVIDHYRRSQALVRSIATSYGVTAILLWQPVIFTEEHLVGAETTVDAVAPSVRDARIAQLFKYVGKALPTDSSGRFFNIADALAGRTAEAYIDDSHLSEDGNLAVARRIQQILLAETRKP